MMDMNDLDILIEQWHALAERAKDNDERHYSKDNRELVAAFRRACLADNGADEFETSKEFCEYVVELRLNEKAWSRQLGEVMLQAQDLIEKGDTDAARTAFDKFQAQCPWVQFIEHAKNQRFSMNLA
jgi:hypothetical protein